MRNLSTAQLQFKLPTEIKETISYYFISYLMYTYLFTFAALRHKQQLILKVAEINNYELLLSMVSSSIISRSFSEFMCLELIVGIIANERDCGAGDDIEAGEGA